MAEINHDDAITHPVAPRLHGKDGDPKPHIGPSIDDYRKAHEATVGEGSDAWWAQVSF
jgi:acetyl-CoA synthetase